MKAKLRIKKNEMKKKAIKNCSLGATKNNYSI